MKVLEEIKVSVYENVYSKKPRVMSFLEVIIMCIHPIYASIINAIRRYYAEGDHAAAQKLKNQLPCFTPAGTFDGAHAIKNFLLPSLAARRAAARTSFSLPVLWPMQSKMASRVCQTFSCP